MGLLRGLLTLPLAPARGLNWVLQEVVYEAEARISDPARIRAELAEAEEAWLAGEIDEQTHRQIEEELMTRLHEAHGR
jgi:hypothetical protein